MAEYILIAVLIGGGEIRGPATAVDCIHAYRLQEIARTKNGRIFAFDDRGEKRYAAEFRCEKKEVPTS